MVAPANAVKLSEKELESVAGLYGIPYRKSRRVYVKDAVDVLRAPSNESELAPLGATFLMLGVRNGRDSF